MAYLIPIIFYNFSQTQILVVYSIPPLLFTCLVCILPESLIWLAKKGKVNQLEKTMLFLRGQDYPVEAEMEEIFHCLNSEKDNTKASITISVHNF